MLSRAKHKYFAFFVILTDASAIFLSFVSAYWLRFSGIIASFRYDSPPFDHYINAIFLVVIPINLFIFRSYRLYQPERHVRRIYELLNVVKAVTIATMLVTALTFFYRDFSYSRTVLLMSWVLSALFCSIGRYALIQFEYYIRSKKDRDRVLIVGSNTSARNLIRWAKLNPHYGQDVVAIIVNASEDHEKHIEDVPIVGDILDMNEILTSQAISEVIVADPALPRETISDMMIACEKKMIGFKLVADFYGLITTYVDVEYVSNVPLLGLKEPPLEDPWNRLVKRTFDFVVSSIILVVLAPLLALTALLLKITSKGPILYRQERVGRDGVRFQLYKFRTMIPGAEKSSGPVWASPSDARVTRAGRLLRKTNMDELPQLWNVLIGNMSLVGPRPERPYFVEQFRNQIPRYMARHKIKSGVTGWAQIHGLRGNTSLEERIKYDLYYMENWTLMMDIEILIATLFAYKNAY
jgi:exopolysaccharide biosynthesis polyprenyl glycosylphosphotransferase